MKNLKANYVIINEEEWSAANLANRTRQLTTRLKNEINILKTSNNRQQTDSGNKMLKTLTEDFYQLVLTARKAMLASVSSDVRTIANKIEKIWRNEIYPLIKEYDDCIEKYNKRTGDNLKCISKRTGDKINRSVKTKYFNY